MQEVLHHLSTRLSTALYMKKKAPWPILPFQIGLYEIKNLKVMDTVGKATDKFSSDTQDFNMYDLRNIVNTIMQESIFSG